MDFLLSLQLPLFIKALHIIFVVTWFSGLFYILRLFVYHSEAQSKQEAEKNILQSQFKIMEKRLWYFITVPSMYLTLASGLYLVYEFNYWMQPWMLLKFAFVFGLVLYHLQCGVIFRQFQKDVIKYSSLKLRLWNEVATLFLVAIVFIIILKNLFDFAWGMLGILLFALCLWIAVRWYRKLREKEGKTQAPTP